MNEHDELKIYLCVPILSSLVHNSLCEPASTEFRLSQANVCNSKVCVLRSLAPYLNSVRFQKDTDVFVVCYDAWVLCCVSQV